MRLVLAKLFALGGFGLFVLAGIWLESAADDQPYQMDDETYRQGAALFVAVGSALVLGAFLLARKRGS